MRITRLKLTDWGPHKNLDLDMDAPVVGLLGPNYSGKSNILQSIEFALTGNLIRNQDAYVRLTSEDNPPKNGKVELTFKKNGLEGKIMRQVGASPMKKLDWQSRTWKKSAEIENILKEVLGCDRKALSRAVFLNQGHIGDFLFQNPAERESTFATLCLIDHLPKVGKVIEDKLFDLKNSQTDHTMLHDEVQETIREAKAATELRKQELEEFPDRSKSIEWLRDLESINSSIEEKQSLLQKQLYNKSQTESEIKSHTRPDWIKNIEDVSGLISETHTKIKDQQNIVERLNNYKNQKRQNSINQERKDYLEKNIKELESCLPRLDSLPKQIEEWSYFYDRCLEKEYYDTKIQSSKERLAHKENNLNQKRVEVDEANKNYEAAKKQTKELPSLDQKVGKLEMLIELLSICKNQNNPECPLCESHNVDKIKNKIENLDDLEKELKEKKQKTESIREQYREAYSERNKSVTELDYFNKEKEEEQIHLQELISLQPSVIGEYQSDQVKHWIKVLEQEKQDLLTKVSPLKGYMGELENLESYLSNSTPDEKLDEVISREEANLVDVNELQRKLKEAEKWQERENQLKTLLNKYKDQISNYEEEIKEKNKQLETHSNNKPEAVKKRNLNNPKELREEFEINNKHRDKHEGQLTNAIQHLRKCEKRFNEVKELITKQGRLREVISELERLKSAFSRNGIQRHYLTRIFDVLSEGTRENMDLWDTDFQVYADPDIPFNFRFFHNTDPDTTFDQSQLSGGQRIRLSISFLLANQQRIVPDLNFMVLDEPTTHLDENGVDGLANLFMQMGEHLDNHESQAIVVDHHEGLKKALSKSHVFGAK